MLFHYFRSIQQFNIVFSILTGMFACIGASRPLHAFLTSFWVSLFSGGFLLSLFFYELRYKRQYYFYYNKGISKIRLILLSYLLQLPFLALYIVAGKIIDL